MVMSKLKLSLIALPLMLAAAPLHAVDPDAQK